ncbi:hypothetical protein CAOG_01007 [Capsaspora owczarzaki ATCC 30864]|uniref:hypothetical protein n=1 Tax=Capsaspora owczarzaki (strain ATCC 30864) TaxID=595528 RepID=UPI00035224F6|nr:hypothetical protein CAOG_01007 [Capsaspora owczarzaki ATCC 30864]|eukprot:XP_004365878.2 hypothetical protein CAOG_01007 [Capsaspora owczarzaki ATCC 30864]
MSKFGGGSSGGGGGGGGGGAGNNKRVSNLLFSSETPTFLRKMQEQLTASDEQARMERLKAKYPDRIFKAGANGEDDDEVDDIDLPNAEDRPTVVVLRTGDLTMAQADVARGKRPASDADQEQQPGEVESEHDSEDDKPAEAEPGKIAFRSRKKPRVDDGSASGTASSKLSTNSSTAAAAATSKPTGAKLKQLQNTKLLSFDDEDG